MNTSTIIKKLFATFPNGNATPATVLVYVERLSGISEHELEVVVNQCIDECEFLPTIAKLKEMHRRMHSGVSPDKAADGWISVQRAMRDPATYSPTPEGPPPRFKDPLVQKAVEALGWHNLRLSENAVADRAQFLKFYQMFAGQDVGEQRLSGEYKQLRDIHTEETNGNGIVRRISG